MVELFAIGFSYSVQPLTERLLQEGWSVSGTTRDAEKAHQLEQSGIAPVIWEGQSSLSKGEVTRADVIVISVPPDEKGCPAARALPDLTPGTVCLYLSSSGVYGDHDGGWVDENAICAPTSTRGQRRLLAERQWLEIAKKSGARLHLCRLSGIYGPGRNALESLQGKTRGAKAGLAQRVIKPGHVFNRIHQDDISSALYALINAKDAIQILNFADDEPSPPQDVIAYAASLLGIEPPREVAFEEAKLSPMARSFYTDNKRLRNDCLKSLPDFTLQYPTYRDGLQALLANQV